MSLRPFVAIPKDLREWTVWMKDQTVGNDGQDVIVNTIKVNGRIDVNVTTVTTTSHTIADEYVILVDDDTAGSTVTLTLPASSGVNTVYHIKKLGTTADVIIDGNLAESIDGGLTATLTAQYETVMIVSDGLNWHVI